MKQKRVGIDCRLSGSDHAGIGRYVSSLVRELVKQKPNYRLVLFFYSNSQAKEVLQSYSQDQIEIVIAHIKHYTFAEQWQFAKILKNAQLDLLHVPHFNAPLLYGGQLIITIHDLLWHEQKGLGVTTLNPFWYWIKYGFYRFVSLSNIKKARAIIVPSEVVKAAILGYYPTVNKKIKVISEGVDDHFFPLKLAKKKRQLLYVGSLYPHKNVNLILKVLQQLPEYTLILVGARNVFVDSTLRQAARLKVKHQVKFAGKKSDQDLNKLYNQSSALIQPSLSEGFGLTGIEAMKTNTPVLASNIDIFKEVYQDHALYFDPHNHLSLVNQIKNIESVAKTNFLNNAYRYASNFSFSKMAEEISRLYQSQL